MEDYFKDVEIIYAKDYDADISDAKIYQKKSLSLGYVKGTDMFPAGTKVCVRTLEGDLDVLIQDDIYIMIGILGEVYPIKKEKFERSYQCIEKHYSFCGEYEPNIKDVAEAKNVSLIPYAKACVSTGEVYIYAKELKHRIKVFTAWDEEKYMVGKEGDYLAVRKDDLHDIYVIEQNIFAETYEPIV